MSDTLLPHSTLFRAGECLVCNDTRVIPAQLEGRRPPREGDGAPSAPGASIGATLHKRIDLRRWQAFVRHARRLRVGETVDFGSGGAALAGERLADGSFVLAFPGDEPVGLPPDSPGRMPLT